MNHFVVGQKVVCVNDTFDSTWNIIRQRPFKDKIYTIRALTMFKFADGEWLSLFLKELVNPIREWGDNTVCECAFEAGRFRPLIERKTSIEIFEKMLKSVPEYVS